MPKNTTDLLNHSKVDIFSDDFFAEDPFGDHHQDYTYYNDGGRFQYDNFHKMQLELYTVEEQISHSGTGGGYFSSAEEDTTTCSAVEGSSSRVVKSQSSSSSRGGGGGGGGGEDHHSNYSLHSPIRSRSSNNYSKEDDNYHIKIGHSHISIVDDNEPPDLDGGAKDKAKADDSGVTDSTCKSTSYESTEFTTFSTTGNNNNNHAPSVVSESPTNQQRRIASPLVEKTQRRTIHEKEECTHPSCELLRLTIQQQEEQIWFLRHRLQEYADLCERHNIGQELLAEHDDEDGITTASPGGNFSGVGSGKTNYEEKTYSDLMGPWDIPFHVQLECTESPTDDDCSGITFAQHPSKTKEAFHRIRNCPTDDDDALPLIRPIRRTTSPPFSTPPPPSNSRMISSSSSSPTIERVIQQAVDDVEGRRSEIFRLQLPTLEEENYHQEESQKDSISREAYHQHEQKVEEVEDSSNRVRKMAVVIERKYGRQKAFYTGMISPRSGCPHGAGTLQFVKSGDVYIGEIAYGEMHGKGTYCHRKTNRMFRGSFVRNTYIGKPQTGGKKLPPPSDRPYWSDVMGA